MIRLTFVLLVAVSLAAGVGWLGHAGYPPLVIAHEGETIVIRGPGEREQLVGETTRRVGFRVPWLSEARVVDTRLRVTAVHDVPIDAADERLGARVWWRCGDPATFVDAWPRAQGVGEAVAEALGEPFADALAASRRDASGHGATEALLTAVAGDALRGRGIEVVGVRVAEQRGDALLETMRTEREGRRAALRREVAEVAARMTAEARREAAQIESHAARDAEITRGQAEAEAARIYADAHGEAPEFFAFSRRLETYRNTLGPNTTLVLSPEHEFFRLLSPDALSEP